jgi:hypothetical protein
MNRDIIKGVSIAGNALTLLLSLLIGSSIYCQIAGLSHPLEGGTLAAGVFLGSPLIVLFQVLAIVMTRMSDMQGTGRVIAMSLNILGLLVGLWLVMILLFFVRMGPINPG